MYGTEAAEAGGGVELVVVVTVVTTAAPSTPKDHDCHCQVPDRIAHTHLKDVDDRIAAQVNDPETTKDIKPLRSLGVSVKVHDGESDLVARLATR